MNILNLDYTNHPVLFLSTNCTIWHTSLTEIGERHRTEGGRAAAIIFDKTTTLEEQEAYNWLGGRAF